MIANLNAELEKLYELLNERKVDYERVKQEKEELRRVCERSLRESQSQNPEGAVYRERFENLQREIAEL